MQLIRVTLNPSFGSFDGAVGLQDEKTLSNENMDPSHLLYLL